MHRKLSWTPLVSITRLGIMTLMVPLLASPAVAQSPPQQSAPRKATPDPYFSQLNKAAKQEPATPPTTTQPATPPRSGWAAPLTPIDTKQLKPQLPATDNGFLDIPPLKIPGQKTAIVPPSSRPQSDQANPGFIANPNTTAPKNTSLQNNGFGSGSIIRNQPPRTTNNSNAPSNTFDNSFGGTGLPPVSSKRKPIMLEPKTLAQPRVAQKEQSLVQPTGYNAPIPKDRSLQQQETLVPFESGKVLALVGGEPIFVGDLMFEINQMIEKHMPNAPESIKQQERQKMIPRILPKFVESKILFQGSIQKLPDEVDVEKVIEQAEDEFEKKALPEMMENSGVKTVAEFDAQLRAQGSSLRSLKRSWSIDQLTKVFVGQQISKIQEVTHREMLEQYQKDIAKYAVPAKARWEQIMIRTDKIGSSSAAKSKVEALTEKVVRGANMSALAESESHGFRAAKGGQHDWTTKGALVLKEIDDAIFTLPIGKLSGAIETRDGYHVIRVIERQQAGRTPFLEAQVEIKKAIVEKRRRDAFAKYMKEMRQQVPVEYLETDAK